MFELTRSATMNIHEYLNRILLFTIFILIILIVIIILIIPILIILIILIISLIFMMMVMCRSQRQVLGALGGRHQAARLSMHITSSPCHTVCYYVMLWYN